MRLSIRGRIEMVLSCLVICLCLPLVCSCSGTTFPEPPEQPVTETETKPQQQAISTAPLTEEEKARIADRHPDARDYYAPLSDYDKENIRYIINTLSHNSTFALMFHKSSLEKVGARTGGIHPLKYLGFIFADPDLKGQVKNIGRTPWSRFKKDFGVSLGKAVTRKNLNDDMVEDFVKTVGIELSKVKPLIADQRWLEFMSALVDYVG